MPAQRDTNRDSGDVSSAALAERLGAAVSRRVNGKHPQNGNGANGNGAIEVPNARDAALEVCRAILAEAGAGTAEHSNDVVLITEAIGERMGLSGADAEDLLVAAQLHDIGKVWMPSRILEKTGPLTDEEWGLMRRHTVVGEQILSSIDELADVGRLVRCSHERWDGAGYPDGLAKDEIPLGSRIIFCADAFHAIRSDRPYRAGRPAREALAEIKRCAGTQFDPAVADALAGVAKEYTSRSRRPRGGSSRLVALLMCLVLAGAGTALARSNLLGGQGPPSSSGPPPACAAAGCPTSAGSVGVAASVPGAASSSGRQVVHPRSRRLANGDVAGERTAAAEAPDQTGLEQNKAETVSSPSSATSSDGHDRGGSGGNSNGGQNSSRAGHDPSPTEGSSGSSHGHSGSGESGDGGGSNGSNGNGASNDNSGTATGSGKSKDKQR